MNWNKLSEWTNKAGNISSKMKEFAKDLVTVDESQDQDDPFTQEFLKAQKQSNLIYNNDADQKESPKKEIQKENFQSKDQEQQISLEDTTENQKDDESMTKEKEVGNKNLTINEASQQTQQKDLPTGETMSLKDENDVDIQPKEDDEDFLVNSEFAYPTHLKEGFNYELSQTSMNSFDEVLKNKVDQVDEIQIQTLNESFKQLLDDELLIIKHQVIKVIEEHENQYLILKDQTHRLQKIIRGKNITIQRMESKLLENSQKMTKLFEEQEQQGFNQFSRDLYPIINQFEKNIFAIFKTSRQSPEQEWKRASSLGPKELSSCIANQLSKCEQLVQREKQQHVKINENYQKLQDMFTKQQESGQPISKRELSLQGENLSLQKRLADVHDKITAAGIQLREKDTRIKELEKFSIDWDKNKRDFVEEIKLMSNEIDTLKHKLKLKQQDVSNANQQVQQSQQELLSVQELQTQIEQKDDEIERLSQLIEEWQKENEQLQNGIQNIQLINEQDEMRRNILQTKYEVELRKARGELEQYSSIGNQFQELSQNYEILKKSSNEESKLLTSMEYKLNKSEQKNIELGIEVAALQKKVKNDQLYQSHLVDRRVVGKFLVNYFDPATEYPVKMQILETLASIMQFSEDDKEKVGFYRMGQHQTHKDQLSPSHKLELQNQQSSPQIPHLQAKPSLKDKFIGFLMENNEG